MQHPRSVFCFAVLCACSLYQFVLILVNGIPRPDVPSGLLCALVLCASSRCLWLLRFHQLAKYPGPALGALTDWLTMYHLITGDRHLYFDHLHKHYGTFVRYAPNRLSINSLTALREIYGVRANTRKSQVYAVGKYFFADAEHSGTEMDKSKHAAKRRVNASAMSQENLKRVEPAIQKNINCFLSTLADSKSDLVSTQGWSKARNVAQIVGYLVSDIMGDTTFSKNWNVQKDPTMRHLVGGGALASAGVHLLGHLPGFFTFNMHRILFKSFIDGMIQLVMASGAIVAWRLQEQDAFEDRDFFSALMKAGDPETGKTYNQKELISEAGLLITAGSDTTTTSISATIFYLLHYPECLERVRAEIDAAFESSADIAGGVKLDGCQYLMACIDETLRMSPPVAGLLPREVLSGGLIVNREVLPAGIDVGVPHYALQHDSKVFPKPSEFKPERWLEGSANSFTAEDLVRAREGLVAFGVGRTSCIGRRLAYRETQLVIARLIFDFDMRIAPGTTAGEGGQGKGLGRDNKREYQILDRFVSTQDGPMVEFRQRKRLSS